MHEEKWPFRRMLKGGPGNVRAGILADTCFGEEMTGVFGVGFERGAQGRVKIVQRRNARKVGPGTVQAAGERGRTSAWEQVPARCPKGRGAAETEGFGLSAGCDLPEMHCF